MEKKNPLQPDRLRTQADILRSVGARFGGEYAWIDKAGMHASEVAMIINEGARKLDLVADEIIRLQEEVENLREILKDISR